MAIYGRLKEFCIDKRNDINNALKLIEKLESQYNREFNSIQEIKDLAKEVYPSHDDFWDRKKMIDTAEKINEILNNSNYTESKKEESIKFKKLTVIQESTIQKLEEENKLLKNLLK